MPSAQIRKRTWGWQILAKPNDATTVVFEAPPVTLMDRLQYPIHFPFAVRYCDTPVPIIPLRLDELHSDVQSFGITSDTTNLGWMSAEIASWAVVEALEIQSPQLEVLLVGSRGQDVSHHLKEGIRADIGTILPEVLRCAGVSARAQLGVVLGEEHHAVHSQSTAVLVVDATWYESDADHHRGQDILRWQVCGCIIGGLTRIMGPGGAELQLALRIWLYAHSSLGTRDAKANRAPLDIVTALRDSLPFFSNARDAAVYSNGLSDFESLRLADAEHVEMQRVFASIVGMEVSSEWVRRQLK
jgi:hypothetical protein